jgi:basic membrane lipoprotein Med (substrate-binding protein (PBP1-ABC) superfamily)
MARCAFGLLLLAPTLAVGACPSASKISVTLVVILASEDGTAVDKRLTDFAKEVQEKYPQLKSFKIKTMTKRSLAPDEKSVFKLVDKETAQIIVKHGADKHNRVSLAVTAPEQGEITYRTVCGKFLPIVTRYQTRAKERLILAIQVQPCNE